jgi:hypothetical protein
MVEDDKEKQKQDDNPPPPPPPPLREDDPAKFIREDKKPIRAQSTKITTPSHSRITVS